MKDNPLLFALVVCLLFVFINAQCPHWSYDDTENDGPSSWGTLCTTYSLCSNTNTSRQSPIDLTTNMRVFAGTKDLSVTYENIYNVTFLNNGHTVQVTNNDPFNSLTFTLPFISSSNISYTNVTSTNTTTKSLPYTLAQFHFHSPSEHTYNNTQLPLELHLVHKNNDTGTIAVLGFLFQIGDPHPWLTHLVEKLSYITNTSESTIIQTLDMTLILDGQFPYYHYPGSLTTPPCTENVDWFIHTMILTASSEQVGRLSQILGRDSRPTQPLNGRIVQSFVLALNNGTLINNGTLVNNSTLINNSTTSNNTQINNTTTTTSLPSTTTSTLTTGGVIPPPSGKPPLPNPYPLPPTQITYPTAKTSGGAVAAILLSILVALVFIGLISRDLIDWFQAIDEQRQPAAQPINA
eukprot:TRINITY_DN2836_c0_g2_i1.p1 TRINITY_DN2836_c0_g2~~TRINITY_DN2836_c0_g2_i1.p1  ORF type:complete len:407 (+),score=73.40 TRINITY_DN2836_c0_g2_i1:93-1313(+)